jgi:hypothetical protein
MSTYRQQNQLKCRLPVVRERVLRRASLQWRRRVEAMQKVTKLKAQASSVVGPKAHAPSASASAPCPSAPHSHPSDHKSLTTIKAFPRQGKALSVPLKNKIGVEVSREKGTFSTG